MFVLGAAGEQLVITLGAHINPWLKMVFEDLSTKERAKRHCFFFPYVHPVLWAVFFGSEAVEPAWTVFGGPDVIHGP